MTIKIAINGYGRIGRNLVRAVYEANKTSELEIVAVNDLAELKISAHLTKYDTAHGIFKETVTTENNDIIINGTHRIKYFSEMDPEKLPWKELGIDVVWDCTGKFKSKELASKHIKAGAKKVLISAPGQDVDATIVHGVNDHVLKASDTIVSNASCTTNCLAPVAKALNDALGIKSGLITSIHAYTNDQVLSDTAHKDPRRARSATMSQIPTTTGAAKAVGLVLPELNGKLDGMAMRVPTINVSIVDLVFQSDKSTTVEEVNQIMLEASKGMKGVMAYNTDPLVSCDFNHNPHASIFDSTLTYVLGGNMVKVFSWYDNEWGFTCQMLETTVAMMNAK
jgi:glyceraldehyde 3-phosphate dehydrogenase